MPLECTHELTSLYFRCTTRLRDQLTHNFVAHFPEAGEKMLGALQMELDDIKASLDKLSVSATEAVVLLIAPDVIGQVYSFFYHSKLSYTLTLLARPRG